MVSEIKDLIDNLFVWLQEQGICGLHLLSILLYEMAIHLEITWHKAVLSLVASCMIADKAILKTKGHL